MSRSVRLLETHAADLDRALDMRFVREVTEGTIGDQAFADYLRIEEAFVVTAARVHGYAVWAAPSWDAVHRNGLAVHALVTEQIDYFRDARARWPVPARPGAGADRLSDFILGAVETGGYPAAMTALFAAETLYLTWCTRAHATGTVPPGPIGDWVALHTAPPFRAGVARLADQVDQIPPTVPDDHLDAWFTGMLDAEITFHDAVFT
ncbi:TenA family protein [Pseudonocardia spinosispora]|uniref:TenA family protein n=1 Tax=Pseudonocardia spinosispora TaxID=103441 RepID=UPI000407D3B3|nr:TenA family protein [Pseudonocardia spinosispora]